MSTCMDGIVQQDLFSGTMRMDVVIPEADRYRVLSEILPWIKLGKVVNHHRALRVDINDGRPLNLRLHVGALIAQGMNCWTDRETEEMVFYHAGVRLLCGLSQSSETMDHTSHTKFRNQVGPEGIKEVNGIAVLSIIVQAPRIFIQSEFGKRGSTEVKTWRHRLLRSG